ncbi:MAG: nucleotidyltransferase domain-containing protein [Magnetococcus sp. THC-1_WYH]
MNAIDITQTWQPLTPILQNLLPGLLAVYAFGSRINGTTTPESDLDLAVLMAGKADPVVLWNVADTLAEQTKCPVDLIDLRNASTIMQYQIIITGQRLWQADHQAGLFEAMILSEKTTLDEARAPLLAIIEKEGTIHGR